MTYRGIVHRGILRLHAFCGRPMRRSAVSAGTQMTASAAERARRPAGTVTWCDVGRTQPGTRSWPMKVRHGIGLRWCAWVSFRPG